MNIEDEKIVGRMQGEIDSLKDALTMLQAEVYTLKQTPSTTPSLMEELTGKLLQLNEEMLGVLATKATDDLINSLGGFLVDLDNTFGEEDSDLPLMERLRKLMEQFHGGMPPMGGKN
ncbi:MAG: hypothetical protein WC291_12185 [Thermodesulfovibrionales bacterium]|jgi:hypothetical protein